MPPSQLEFLLQERVCVLFEEQELQEPHDQSLEVQTGIYVHDCVVTGDATPPSQFEILLQVLVCWPVTEQTFQLLHDQEFSLQLGGV